MTETENVSKKLIEDAESTGNDLLAEARKKAESVLEEAADARKSILAKGKILADKAYKQSYDFAIARISSEMEQKLLEEKIKMVDEVLAGITDRLRNLPAEDLKKLLLKFAHRLDFKKAVYQLGKDEKKITDLLVREIFGTKTLIKSTLKPDFAMGLKIIDERKEYYFSEETLMDLDSEDIKMEISKLLFT